MKNLNYLFSPQTYDIDVLIVVALVLIAAFIVFIFFKNRHKD